ncbi:sensor histidine kinase [Flammeovirgaceae bacterium SG7u.111]|nr:sensor histidine kinase [Flammeovirgaceae bacterium SG7u.132]WPO34886.1 sensor histidine kinase [Flammeovirgaceae bacterium SG7u.111]
MEKGTYDVLHRRALFLEDVEGMLTLEDVTSPSFENSFSFWKSIDTKVSPEGRVYWFKIPVRYAGEGLSNSYALSFNKYIDSLELFMLNEEGSLLKQELIGSAIPFSQRTFQVNGCKRPVVSINISTEEVTYLYGRMVFTSYLSSQMGKVDIHLISNQLFLRNEIHRHYFKGAVLGSLIITIILNLFIFLYYRDRSQMLLVVTVVTNLIFFISYTADLEFLISSPTVQNTYRYLGYISGAAGLVSYLYFVHYFLRPAIPEKWFKRVVYIITFLLSTNVVCGFVLEYRSFYTALFVFGGTVVIFTSSVGLMAYLRKYRPALLFLIASIASLIGILLFVFANLGVVYYYIVTDYILQMGEILMLLVFTIGLGYRYYLEKEVLVEKLIEQERIEKKQKEEISAILSNQNKTLEVKIKERTQELEAQKKELEDTNKVKDKLFSIISHDLRSPLAALDGFLKLFSAGALNTDEIEQMKAGIQEKFNKANSLMDNLLNWARSQMQGLTVNVEVVQVDRIALKVVQLYRTEADKKSIELKQHIEKGTKAFADPSMLELIIRNLVANAVKFTPYMGKVSVEAETSKIGVTIKVRDTGMGMKKETIAQILNLDAQISTTGTANEKGTGLGLVLCKEFIEKNGGELQIESEEGKGSIFMFTLPLDDWVDLEK